ncbi:MAG: hypothetical protein JST54_06705 [Deltaproteobacteria bacterium]|nr:hypothetical protein [Deltaproteobacteria bacterium]
MSRGDDRRKNDLDNLEAAFLDALTRAKAEKFSAYISEKRGARKGAATSLDVELFTLESKIDRMREKLGLPKFEVPLPKAEPAKAEAEEGWPLPPEYEDTRFGLDLAELYVELVQSGRVPEKIFTKVKYLGAKHRQGADQPSWRLAMVDVGDGRAPAKVSLSIYPLPLNADAEVASQKLVAALDRLVSWSDRAGGMPITERPRLLHVTYARATRELAFHAR